MKSKQDEIKELVSSMSDEEINSLSDEEFAKLESALSEQPSTPVAGGDAVVESTPQIEMGMGEAVLRRGAAGITSNFSDEIVSGAQTAYDIASSNYTFSEAGALYNQHKAQNLKLEERAKEVSGGYGTTAEVVGGVAQGFLMPGVSAFTRTVKGAMGVGAAFGGLNALGSAEGSFGDIAGDVVAGSTIGGLTGGVLKVGVDKVGKLISAGGAKTLEEAAENRFRALAKNLGFRGVGYDDLLEDLTIKKISTDQMASDIMREIPPAAEQTKKSLNEAMISAKARVWSNVKSVFDEVDNQVPDGVVDAKKLQIDLEDSMGDAFEKMDPAVATRLQNLIHRNIGSIIGFGKNELGETVLSRSNIPLNDLHKIKLKMVDIFDGMEREVGVASALRKGLGVITNTQREIAEQFPTVLDELLPEAINKSGVALKGAELFKNEMRVYSSLETASHFIKQAARKEGEDLAKYGSSIVDLRYKTGQLLKGDWSDLAGNSIQPGGPTSIVQGFANVLKDSGYNFKDSRALLSADKIYQSLKENPGRYSKDVNSLILNASRGLTGAFISDMAHLDSKMTLSKEPIQLTTESAMNNAPHVLNIARKLDPALADTMSDALESGDKQAYLSILSSAKVLPGLSEYFTPGYGFDGKIMNELEASKIKQQIDVTWKGATRQRMQAHELVKSGIVPNFDTPKQAPFEIRQMVQKRSKDGKRDNSI